MGKVINMPLRSHYCLTKDLRFAIAHLNCAFSTTSQILIPLSEMLCLRKTKRKGEKTLKLKSLKMNTVYPGHGKPFPMELFIRITEKKNKEDN